MHEMALAEGILQVVLDAAEGETVRRISLRVGKLQMVVPDSLEFSFRLVAEGTPAAEAALEMEEIPVCMRCKRCGTESEMEMPPFSCRHCGETELEVVSGDEMLVDVVELASGSVIRRRAVPADEILEEHLKDHTAHGPDLFHE